MKHVTGCDNVIKIAVSEGDTQRVQVVDGDGIVRLSLSSCSYPAGLTPEEARHVAKCLYDSATRVEAVS